MGSTINQVGSQTVVDSSDDAPALPERFELQEELGRGGMGVVHWAFDRELERPVALKVLASGLEDRGRPLQRFLEEAQTTAQLQHPGIVPIYQIGRDRRGRLFYTMKLISGRTLAEVVEEEEGRPSRFRLLELFIEICHTVGYAHERGVVHRDLKPSNVMIGPHQEVQILDWGLAKVVGTAAGAQTEGVVQWNPWRRSTQRGVLVGTPAFMAPEQATGEHDRVGVASDVFALGALLHFVLSGRPPWPGDSTEETIAAASAAERPPSPTDGCPDVSRELDAICRRAMAIRPEDRYRSAEQLAADVQAHLEGRPPSVFPGGLTHRARRRLRKEPQLAVAVLSTLMMMLLSVLIALAWVSHARQDEVGARNRARVEQQQAERLGEELLELVYEANALGYSGLVNEAAHRLETLGEDRYGSMVGRGLRYRGQAQLLRGELEAARRAYRKALERHRQALAEAPWRTESFVDIAKVYRAMAVAEWSAGNLEKAHALLAIAYGMHAHLHRLGPSPTNRLLLARTQVQIGGLLVRMGFRQRAVKRLEAGRRLLEGSPPSELSRFRLAALHKQQGELLIQLGRLEQGLRGLRRSVTIMEQLVTDHHSNEAYQEVLAEACNTLAVDYLTVSRLEEARELARRALGLARRLVEREPENRTRQFLLALVRVSLAREAMHRGELKTSRRHSEEALERIRTLTGSETVRPGWRREQAVLLADLGKLKWILGEARAGLVDLREACSELRSLVNDHPADDSFRRDLVVAHIQLGDVMAEILGAREARHVYRQAVTVGRILVTRDSSWLQQCDLAMACQRLGKVEAILGDDAEAEELLKESLRLEERLRAQTPEDPERLRSLATIRWALGELAWSRGDTETGFRGYEQARALMEVATAIRPHSEGWSWERYDIQMHLGGLYQDQGMPERAAVSYRQALWTTEQLLARHPSDEAFHLRARTQLDLASVLPQGSGRIRLLGEVVATMWPLAWLEGERPPGTLAGSWQLLAESGEVGR